MGRSLPATAGLLLGAVAGVAAALLAGTELLGKGEYLAYDHLSALFADPALAASSRVKIVLMDAEDLRSLGRESSGGAGFQRLPRRLWGEFVEFLSRRRPRAVVLDLLLTDPSRHGEQDDLDLADRLAAARRVILPAGVGRPPVLAAGRSQIPPGSQVPVYGRFDRLPRADSLLLPVSPLLESVRRIGVAAIRPDGDVVRRVPVAFKVGQEFMPSLPIAAAMTAFGESSLNIVHAGRTLQGFAGIDLPLDGHGNLLLNFRGPRGSFRTISVKRLREAMLDPRRSRRFLKRIKKRDILVLGVNLPGNRDEHATPTDPAMPGPEVLATAIDNIVRGDARRPARPVLLRLLPVLFGCAAGLLFARRRRLRAALLSAMLPLLYLGCAVFLFRQGYVLEFLTPPLASLLAMLLLTSLTFFRSRNAPAGT